MLLHTYSQNLTYRKGRERRWRVTKCINLEAAQLFGFSFGAVFLILCSSITHRLLTKKRVVVSSIIGIYFCSRNKPSPDEQCLRAQSLLHPVCAQQPEGGAFGVGVPGGNQQVPCQDIARVCNNNPECKPRLERYNQVCSVDSKTMTCAGPPDACRKGMIDILGTELRTNCGCEGTAADFRELYDCIGYHRSLWVNPCVGKSNFSLRPNPFSANFRLGAITYPVRAAWVSLLRSFLHKLTFHYVSNHGSVVLLHSMKVSQKLYQHS